MTAVQPVDPMGRAWLKAAVELGIRITVPYVISSDLGTATYVAFLPDFGGQRGMVVVRLQENHRVEQLAASDQGLYLSRLADSYSTFKRDLFMDTLNDWGWFGPEDAKPDWYTGEAWG